MTRSSVGPVPPGSPSLQGGSSPEMFNAKNYYFHATRICPEARQSQPDPEVLARQMKARTFRFRDISAEEVLDILKMGREQGWPSGEDESDANLVLSTGKLVSRSDVEYMYSSEVDDHPELATAESHDPQLAQEIKADRLLQGLHRHRNYRHP